MKFFDDARLLLQEPLWYEWGFVDNYLSPRQIGGSEKASDGL